MSVRTGCACMRASTAWQQWMIPAPTAGSCKQISGCGSARPSFLSKSEVHALWPPLLTHTAEAAGR